jgi:hypothetical protein
VRCELLRLVHPLPLRPSAGALARRRARYRREHSLGHGCTIRSSSAARRPVKRDMRHRISRWACRRAASRAVSKTATALLRSADGSTPISSSASTRSAGRRRNIELVVSNHLTAGGACGQQREDAQGLDADCALHGPTRSTEGYRFDPPTGSPLSGPVIANCCYLSDSPENRQKIRQEFEAQTTVPTSTVNLERMTPK